MRHTIKFGSIKNLTSYTRLKVGVLDYHEQAVMLQLFKGLKGVWELKRSLGTRGHMQGVARFQTWKAGVLYYRERGSTNLGNRLGTAYREYAYAYDQGTVAVHFWDQQHQQPADLLHTLHLQSCKLNRHMLVATGTHWCAEDVYRACYTFVNCWHFRLTYQVHGPNKNYIIQTHYNKIAAC